MAYSEARNKATQKYLAANKEQLRAWVKKGDLQRYKNFAAAQGYSLNALVITLLDAAIAGDIPVPPVPPKLK